ncbi:MAG: UbiX family flavin prenyltransferase [Thermodesulfovibrionia bacterium]|nr:UbiX family flavin prenyltransferase [Thermodesulfovibrionia bacterium]
MKTYIVAITGASGSIYGIRLIQELIKREIRIYLVVSKQSFSIITFETGINWSGKTNSETEKKIQDYFSSKNVRYYSEDNLSAPVASGSLLTDGMFVIPCSMKTLSGIAHGYAGNLIDRAADVTLKEGRMLTLVPREMPFNAIHLENMLKLARLGVKIIPPMPAFYHKPKTINDMVDFVVGKTLDSSGIGNKLFKRWK